MRNLPNHGGMLTAVILVLLKISVLSVCGQDRTEYQSKWVENKLNLHDHVEELSSISTIQSMGFTGQGGTIALISTGIDKNHEQFSGRVIAENCFNSGKKCVRTERCSDCGEDEKDCLSACYDCEDHFVCENNGNSSNPVNALKKESFNQGSHLTGIAAGADGIAPGANIIAVNIQSEFINHPDLITEENPEGYGVAMEKEDLMKALKKARGYIRHSLGQRMIIRYTPELIFVSDRNIAYGVHIAKVLADAIGTEEKGDDIDEQES